MSSDSQPPPLGRTTSGSGSLIERLKSFGRGRRDERGEVDCGTDGQSTLVHGGQSRSSSGASDGPVLTHFPRFHQHTVMDAARSRSRSRTRDLVSTGRGGAGNIVPKSAETVEGVDEPRGRELTSTSDRITHSGRGGAGNIRSPSRDPEARKAEAAESAAEAAVVHDHAAHDTGVHSSGRGGWGNISRSRSPAPNRVPLVSSGRGGAGNVHAAGELPDGHAIAEEDAGVIASHKAHEHGVIHSTGRGGDGNIVPGTPVVPEGEHAEQVHATEELEHHPHSTGRGGAGNIVGEDEPRGRTEHTHGGLLHKIGDFVKNASKSRERSVDKN
ncbi:hypothetical protein CALCODRAFT_148054 [Calocera cornea HHB12733]|uniref:Uncharacterized protein n=1 Tax=Calocera cornea HHB12733 TaxID=1353952 RepID=A0A165CQM4_9BASI|nr:hypothetical protein CALCODRAFT_148054 [Calocera cornea HHB12733]